MCARWSAAEDRALLAAVAEHGARNWKAVAAMVPGRSHAQCLQRYSRGVKPGLRKGSWSKAEDELLMQLVAPLLLHPPPAPLSNDGRNSHDSSGSNYNHNQQQQQQRSRGGGVEWPTIAAQIEGRTTKQCRERWFLHLNPSINRAQFTAEEDEAILAEYEARGSKWALIARRLGTNRTAELVKSRWKALDRIRRQSGGGVSGSMRQSAHIRRDSSVPSNGSFNSFNSFNGVKQASHRPRRGLSSGVVVGGGVLLRTSMASSVSGGAIKSKDENKRAAEDNNNYNTHSNRNNQNQQRDWKRVKQEPNASANSDANARSDRTVNDALIADALVAEIFAADLVDDKKKEKGTHAQHHQHNQHTTHTTHSLDTPDFGTDFGTNFDLDWLDADLAVELESDVSLDSYSHTHKESKLNTNEDNQNAENASSRASTPTTSVHTKTSILEVLDLHFGAETEAEMELELDQEMELEIEELLQACH